MGGTRRRFRVKLLIVSTITFTLTITIIMAVITNSFHKLRGGGAFWRQEGLSIRVALKLQTEHSS